MPPAELLSHSVVQIMALWPFTLPQSVHASSGFSFAGEQLGYLYNKMLYSINEPHENVFCSVVLVGVWMAVTVGTATHCNAEI